MIGAGHNGLVCACYLARRGLEVTVLEAAPRAGGCVATQELPDCRGRLELGAYELGGIRQSGVAEDLDLERHGLGWHLRDELTLAPCDDGTAIALHRDLDRTVVGIADGLGATEAAAYRGLAGFSQRAMRLLGTAEHGPAPSPREMAALLEASVGSRAAGELQRILLGSAANLLRERLGDDRLRGPLAHWASHSQQPPGDPGTAIGVLVMAGAHGTPAARPRGGSGALVSALVRALEDAGGRLVLGAEVEAVEVSGGRASAVLAGGERYAAGRAVVSTIDAKRLFEGLVAPEVVPAWLAAEVASLHVAARNVSELKIDAIIDRLPTLAGPDGFERALLLSSNGLWDLERAFASIQLGRLPERPPLMIAFPSTLEPGWAPEQAATAWVSTFVPWWREEGPWDASALEQTADRTWTALEGALGQTIPVRERQLTGPLDWVARTGNPAACPNHIDMSVDQLIVGRPSPGLAGYATPIPGLYLSGAGTHPGGGVTGLPGRNAAAAVLDDLGIRRRSRLAQVRERAALARDATRAAWRFRRAS